jgi:hypothetical protein
LAIFCQIANASSESATIRKNIDDAKRQQFLRAQGSSKGERLGAQCLRPRLRDVRDREQANLRFRLAEI